jgi:hypothetical protein
VVFLHRGGGGGGGGGRGGETDNLLMNLWQVVGALWIESGSTF